jgi:DNA-directed RNA polymerase II subunit RPB1
MEIFFVEEEDELNDRHVFVLMNKLLHKFAIKGNMEIKKVFTKQENDGWTIETDGIDMNTIFKIPEFDGNTCISNDVLNIYETLGIEAARAILFEELKKVVEFDGSYINRRHFYTLIDTMTHKGDIMSITRHGINRTDTGPLMKCSFEETVDILTDAAIYSETDNLSGVTEKIIMGKLTSVGTGDCEVMYNAPTMSKNESFLLATPDSSEMEYEESYYPDEIESYFPIT